MNTEPIETGDKLLSLRGEAGNQSLLVTIESYVESVAEIVKQSESLVPDAEAFEVDSEVAFQFNDDMRISLEQGAKDLDNVRMPLTRVLDDLKTWIIDQVRPGIANNKAAAAIRSRKGLEFRAKIRAEAEQQRRVAEAEQRRKQDALNAAAAKREADAQKLRSEAGRRKAQEEADALRQAAVHTPVSMAVSAPEPVSTSSNVDEKWHWEIEDWTAYCRWLAEHPEWLSDRGKNNRVVDAKLLATNKMINHYGDTIAIPGVKVWTEEHFRKKPSRQ